MMRPIAHMTVLFAVIALVLSSQLSAQVSGVTYDRVLLPMVLESPLPGANGSLWVTALTITNTATEAVSVFPYFGTQTCDGCSTPLLAANSSVSPFLAIAPGRALGNFLYVDDAHRQDVKVSLRARDLSRASMTWGTTMPVVPDEAFRSHVTVTDIPVSMAFRQTIRIYGSDALDPTPVRVTMYGRSVDAANPTTATQDVILGNRDLILQTNPDQAFLEYPAWPSYLEFGGLGSIGSTNGFDTVRLDFVSLATGKRIWAFVSVTNNETQHVTVLQPN